MIDKILNIIATSGYDQYRYTWGLRHDRGDHAAGTILDNSRQWVDGRMTDIDLGGTSAIYLGLGIDIDADDVREALSRVARYGQNTYLVCGIRHEYGEDEHEVVLQGCEVVTAIE